MPYAHAKKRAPLNYAYAFVTCPNEAAAPCGEAAAAGRGRPPVGPPTQAPVRPPERPVTFGEVAQAVLAAAVATDARPITLTIRPRRIDLLVCDHRVVVEVARGVVRVVWVGTPIGGPATRDPRVALDDADEAVVAAMVGRAIEEGMTPF